jgi:hypothetical protein
MPENNSSSTMAVALLVGWIVFAIVYPMLWEPHDVALWRLLKPDERAYVLKLPEGPLAHMLGNGSILTLRIESGQGVEPAYQPNVPVLARQCLYRQDRGQDCYAIVGVPVDLMRTLDSSTKVSAWFQQQ